MPVGDVVAGQAWALGTMVSEAEHLAAEQSFYEEASGAQGQQQVGMAEVTHSV